jgi:hypothetical protein
MHNKKIKLNFDYKSYSTDELQDVCENIDKDKHPSRYKEALNALANRKSLGSKSDDVYGIESDWSWARVKSTKMKIIVTILFFLGLSATIYGGEILGRYGGSISVEDEPYLFWVLIIFLLNVGIVMVLSIIWRNKSKDNET